MVEYQLEEIKLPPPVDIHDGFALLCLTQPPPRDIYHLVDQASSSLGPLFWPLHPTIERMWQFSVLTDTVTDFTWPDSDVNITTSDGSNVTEILSTSSRDDLCSGHAGSDVFPYGLLDNDTDANFQVNLLKQTRARYGSGGAGAGAGGGGQAAGDHVACRKR